MNFDFIIVGGGSAGCTLAARLTQDPATRVLLVEAGRNVAPGSEPADIADIYASSYFNKKYMWPGLKAHWRTRASSPAITYDQARVLGGGSSVMGMIALRGTPADYDEWETLGAVGWGWNSVEPFFRKLETDLDGPRGLHGHDGPIPIRRLSREEWPPLAAAAGAFGDSRSLPFVADMNTDFRDGYGMQPISSTQERRATAATCYLNEQVRRRPNLKILTDTEVTRVMFESCKAVGIETLEGKTQGRFLAREIILSAGAIHTPVLLMRSGVGDGHTLQDAGIALTANKTAVGRNLQNHAILFLALNLGRDSRQARSLRPHPTAGFRFTAPSSLAGSSDMYMNVHSKSSWSPLGEQVANVAPILLKPTSRGKVSLAGGVPLVEFNFLDTKEDRRRIGEGFRFAADFVLSDFARGHYRTAFPVRFTDRLRRLNARNSANAHKAAIIARMFDMVPGLARLVFTAGSDGTAALERLADHEAALARHVVDNIGGMYHVAGTCRMGVAGDPDAVTASDGKVHGLEGLRVCDASLMPTLPRGNTNIPTIMLAEKIATSIVDSRRG